MTAVRIGLAAVSMMAAQAQQVRPAKLVVIGQGIAITDYPSMARCEAARAYIARLIAEKNAGIETVHLPGGGVVTTLPLSLQSFCVPG